MMLVNSFLKTTPGFLSVAVQPKHKNNIFEEEEEYEGGSFKEKMLTWKKDCEEEKIQKMHRK